VALEGKVTHKGSPTLFVEIYVDNPASPFVRSNDEAFAVPEYGNRGCVILESRLFHENWVIIVVHHVLQVPYRKHLFRVGGDEKRELQSQVVNWLSHPTLSNLVRLPVYNVEELNVGVPSSGHQENHPVMAKRSYVFDRGFVLANRDWLASLLAEVPSLD